MVGFETLDEEGRRLEWPTGSDNDVHCCRVGQWRKGRVNLPCTSLGVRFGNWLESSIRQFPDEFI